MSTHDSAKRRILHDTIPDSLLANEKIVFFEFVVVFILVWAAVTSIFGLEDTISSPLLVASSSYTLLVSMEWVPHVVATLRRSLYGFIVTMIVGTGLGVMMGWSNFWEKALQDYIVIGLAIPSLFAAVFSAMWFGVSDITPTVAAATISFPFVTQTVYQAVKDVDPKLIEMSSSFGVSRRRVVRRVVVQSVLPEWFGGARYGFAICWKITTLAELIAAETGIGFMIQQDMNALSITGVLSWTLLFLLIILLVEYGVFQQIEKRVFEWRQQGSIGW